MQVAKMTDEGLLDAIEADVTVKDELKRRMALQLPSQDTAEAFTELLLSNLSSMEIRKGWSLQEMLSRRLQDRLALTSA